MTKRFCLFLLLTIFVFQNASLSFAASDSVFNPNLLVRDDEMTNSEAMTKEELSAFLTRGTLASFKGPDVFGTQKTAAEIILHAAQTFELNPQFLLVLLQREQSLVEKKSPAPDALDWAMGYAVCDDCAKNDPQIQKFKGFGNQVYHAAKRIRTSFLSDLDTKGRTITGVGPGIPVTIDGSTVVPANNATSVLYSYTPHLHGNYNFTKIWNRWFTRDFPNGSLLQDKDTGGVYLIQNNAKRPITSKAAFASRFNTNNIVIVPRDTLDRYEMARPITLPNYSLLRSKRGTVYLIVDDSRRGFASQEAFRVAGFVPDEIIDVSDEDLAMYAESEPITAKTVYPEKTLLQNKKTGGIFAVQNGKKHPLVSREILSVNFPHPYIIPVTEKDLSAYETAHPESFRDGTLVAVHGSPDVFVIENGRRRPIGDATTFLTYGWKWNQIVWTNERSVLLSPLGETLTTKLIADTMTLSSNR